jgi:hypothetical protein
MIGRDGTIVDALIDAAPMRNADFDANTLIDAAACIMRTAAR